MRVSKEELYNISDILDESGFSKEADMLDSHINRISKTAKRGMHKCGLAESTVEQHEELLDGYDKSKSFYEKEFKKTMLGNEKDSPNQGKLRELTSAYAHNCNSVRLHNMYFDDVIHSKPFPIEKDAIMESLLKSLYKGGANKFRDHLLRLALVPRSGWVVLNYCVITKELYLDVIDLHDQHVIATGLPVMALDLWEHAYVADFGNDRAAYTEWFLDHVDFRNVRKRIKNYQRVK